MVYFHCFRSSCDDQPCKNGATCLETPDGGFKCLCDARFIGETCSEKVNVCQVSKPCQGGSPCFETKVAPFYRCDCPLGVAGNHCEEKVSIRKRMSFKGNGFVEFPATHRHVKQ